MKTRFSRRHFMGSAAAALGAVGLRPKSALGITLPPPPKGLVPVDPYDDLAKLSSNENPYGPSEKMMASMNAAWKYSNRYGYPDGDVHEKIAEHHGVGTDHIIMHAGSGETLKVAALAFLRHEEKVVGVEPTFLTVYRAASGVDADAITRPLLPDHTQDIDDLIQVTKRNYRDVGMVYVCNPNNPTGVVVSDADIRHLLDNIPEDIPVLIDEAYHHFVQDPSYATAVPYIKEGRKVLVTRTFSKIYGMAGPAARLRDRPARDDRPDADLHHRHDQRARQVGRRGGARGHRVREMGKGHDDHASRRDGGRAARPGLRGDPVGDQLLHGPHRPARVRGESGVPPARCCRGARLPADARLSPGVDWDGG